jgi:uncharacterized membrane protein
MIESLYYNYEVLIRLFTVFFVCFVSLAIYFKSKNLHNLTNHRGIKIFGYAFLYLFVGYLVNFVMFYIKEFFSLDF